MPACGAGTLGGDGARWLLHLVEGAGVVALTSVHISSLSIHYHRVIGETFYGQIDVLSYFLLVVVGIVGINTVEFVA